MQTNAIIRSVDGKYATAEVVRTSACDGCHKQREGGCSVCSLLGSNPAMSVRALNTVGASVGDKVVLESQTSRMLWYALLIFVLPLVVGFLSWWGSSLFTKDMIWQAFFSFVGFIISFLGVFLYSKIIQKYRCDILVTEILTEDGIERE